MTGFMNILKKSLGMNAPTARTIAKERLSIMLVHQRNSQILASIDMEALQKEVAAVVQKYIKVAQDKKPHVTVKQDGELDVLEMHFPMEVHVVSNSQKS